MFYTLTQNNSGGEFIENDNVAHYVIIEADDYEEAFQKAETIGVYFNGCEKGLDCECCGDRWSRYAAETDEPTIYGETIGEWLQREVDMFGKSVILHYADGTKQKIDRTTDNA